MKQDGSLPDNGTYNALIRAHLEDEDEQRQSGDLKRRR